MKRLKLNYPLKIFLIATVISLLPVTLGVSPLDYKGASLEAADDDTKKKKKRTSTLGRVSFLYEFLHGFLRKPEIFFSLQKIKI